MLIIAVGLSFYFIKSEFFETSNLLAESTLLKVEKKEKEYESAIAELEKIFREHNEGQEVVFEYDTIVYYGQF